VSRQGKVQTKPGDLLRSVTLHSTSGREVDVAAEATHRHVVMFFYPGDREGLRYPELAGCTVEACAFRDHLDTLCGLGAVLFGVSLQSTERQRQFVEREHLSFELLSDDQKKLVSALGIPMWICEAGEECVARTTVVVARGGRVAAVFEDVDVAGHAEAVIEVVRQL
jgi:peroxiredoxin Q/BCP